MKRIVGESKIMQEIIIDKEFERILPKLDEQTYAWLEENILEYGCREPLVLWNNILIDGHNRYSILQKHELPINTIDMVFDSRDEVLIWIISTQVSRRNLNPLQLSFYRGLHYNADKKIHGDIDRFVSNYPSGQNDRMQGGTAGRLAEQYRVSPKTIRRDAHVANAINAIGEVFPDVKMDILSGKTHITRKQLHELTNGTDEDVSNIVEKIVDGRFEGGKPGTGNVSGSDEMRPWERQFSKMANEFRKILRDHEKTDNTESARSALRKYIEMLEEFYRNM